MRLSQTTACVLLLAAQPMQRGGAAPAAPALYTKAQAQRGHAVFEQNCASCHGHHLEGRVGPALKGPTFASAKSGFTIEQIYEFLSVEMPAYAPGSLTPQQYLDITAFLLQQNGYPAGSKELTNTVAAQSSVPLLYQSSGKPTSDLATSSAPEGKSSKPKTPKPQGQAPHSKPLAASLADVPQARALPRP